MRTEVSPTLKRRQVHPDASNYRKSSPRKGNSSPEKPLEKDISHGSSDDEDEVDDIEIDCAKEQDLHRRRLDPCEKTGARFSGGKGKNDLYPHLPDPYEEMDAKFSGAKGKNSLHTTCHTQEYKGNRSGISRPTSKNECSKSRNMSSNETGTLTKGLFYIMIILVSFCIVYICYSYMPDKPSPKYDAAVIVNKLKTEFVNQPSLSFRVIKNALDKVLQNVSQPNAPAVVLLISAKGANYITTCFAKQLANLIASGNHNFPTIYGSNFQHKDPDEAKEELDDLISNTLDYGNQKVVLIENLDIIPSKAAMILHGYCDDQNAPFKNAVFIMTVYTDMDISDNSDSAQYDEVADRHLTKVWNDLGEDKLAPLLTRITVSVAAIYRKDTPKFCE